LIQLKSLEIRLLWAIIGLYLLITDEEDLLFLLFLDAVFFTVLLTLIRLAIAGIFKNSKYEKRPQKEA
jgi:hypothetical protein